MQDESLKKVRSLLIALVLSGGLNILLATSFAYWYLKESPPKPYFENKPLSKSVSSLTLDATNAQTIIHLKELSRQELIAQLGNHDLVENGYTKRDLALGCLVSFHHFDLERALPEGIKNLEPRSLVFGKKTDGSSARLMVYSLLTEDQWKHIERFAKHEKWPMTARGLFFALKKPENIHDESLIDAFFLSEEFLAVETLLARAPQPLAKAEILEMLLQGSWQMLAQFTHEQRMTKDLSVQCRQRLLLDYIQHKSKAAAQLILKTDGSFAVRKLDDPHVLLILDLLDDKNSLSERFALALLASPRGSAVWRTAANKLYDFAEEPRPEPFEYAKALAHFLPQHLMKPQKAEPTLPSSPLPAATVIAETQPPKASYQAPAETVKAAPHFKTPPIPTKMPAKVVKDKLYIVQTGDSLWKIARRFNVDVSLLRQHNRLSSDALKPGTPLRIPQ